MSNPSSSRICHEGRHRRRFGLPTQPQSTGGAALVLFRGKARRYTGRIPKLDPLTLADIGQTQLRFDRLAARVNLDEPWRTPRARELDGQTFESWLRRTCFTERGRDFFRVATEAVFATLPSNLSLLHALFYARSGGSLENLITTAGGAQQDRVSGGMGQLAERLAEHLPVVLNSPVRRIEQSDDGVAVHTDTEIHYGRRVIVALPPTLSGRLAYNPEMPAQRDQLSPTWSGTGTPRSGRAAATARTCRPAPGRRSRRAARAGRPHPLGRNGNRCALVRLHRRRDLVGRASCREVLEDGLA
jgi:monoamine oxidase